MTIFTALTDVRVLDLTVNLAGPFSTQILADLGAHVIKVERPGTGDESRGWPPKVDDESVVFASVNRNKRSIVLDFKDADQREIVRRLGASCDVVVESFRPGKAEELGLGYADFKARNAGIIYASVSAFGRGEVGSQLPGYDPLIQAFCGIMSTTGHPGNPPTRVAASIIDLSTGMWSAIGILAALADRKRTGDGQHVEATLVDSGYALMCHQLSGYLATGEVPGQLGSSSPVNAPYEAFQASDGWVMIAAGNNHLFSRLCAALGLDDVATEDRFSTVQARTRHRDELHSILQERVARHSVADAIATIRRSGVPIGPVNEINEAAEDPIVAERSLFVLPDGGDGPDVRIVRFPVATNGEFAETPRRAPALGEHGAEVLSELEQFESGCGHGGSRGAIERTVRA